MKREIKHRARLVDFVSSIKEFFSKLFGKCEYKSERARCSNCKRLINDNEIFYIRMRDLSTLCGNCVKLKKVRIVKRRKNDKVKRNSK